MDSQINKDNTILISPVTRIEGHAKITIDLGPDGSVKDARFHVNEFRGFEKFCEGRYFTEMPTITPRICGICPVSHSVSSAKACEAIMGIKPTYTGDLLRRLIHLGQVISSHALSFFHLSSPDFILGWDSDPAVRNIVGLAQQSPDLALRGIRLRKFGQEISERITGKKIHIMGIVPGGVGAPLSEENRKALLGWIAEATQTTLMGIDLIKKYHDQNKDMVNSFANFPTLYLGTVGPQGEWEVYDGKLRFMDADGKILEDQIDPKNYLDYIAERAIDWSYLKYPYYKPYGFEKGFYRVGPLARLNVSSKMKTPKAQKEFLNFKSIGAGKPVHGTFYFHYTRLIECLSAVEEAERILKDPKITSGDTQTAGKHNYNEGIGSSEAPRGTLFHHYKTDDSGRLTNVNLLIATGQNNPAMNRSVLEVAKQYVHGKNVKEGALNRVEAAIRCYDPCLSCSTHAIGSMPMLIEIKDHLGRTVHVLKRG
ncbi:MAG: Ni/Fe hydrogenase subunit alpha [Candidatus Omnitrophica bacterium]|nr:Ni/Fe hydrogenase subunit alpha [Candidatus Omnitrophota bacterium]MDE2009642.1 Ni/Fe hydrogenase subunit alpha [Candidatus Omnitrophota bacterium]MDE2231570.1 Ni/Fe hydrogenase subunit alpha [Candidatus Omnitrophota bacterium]